MKNTTSLWARLGLLLATALVAILAHAGPKLPLVDSMRGATPLDQEATPPLMQTTENKDVRRGRAYTQQPPTIPHTIDGYQVDKAFNKCLNCHSRTKAEQMQAVPVSITHYVGRDGMALPSIAPARYFCIQCHVPQVEAKPLVENTFTDVESILPAKAKNAKK
ncbi:nitrate reductase cytochrome c-type subunit [Curvibacter sp. APW13]|uniref:nitrate reductase cytochrome c-type subunit n=1 Tax=Curvibacter sp. APW13 TaxID=3077236 RepID=UPI0028DF00B5|nr:nitrate reductase cytochrome c-type subunit [Curvibacter sp. APW13]MDT8990445.1 nitrate reductase cytochrome c-type subunit [Curvibacter sp. APW13]